MCLIIEATRYGLFYGNSVCNDVCMALKQQFCGVMKDEKIHVPVNIGEGYFRYISPCQNIEMYISDVVFYKNTVLSEHAFRESFSCSFCFSDVLEWRDLEQRQSTQLEKGNCCVYGNGSFDVENIYEAGQRYVGIGLNLHPSRFRAVIDCLLEKKALALLNGGTRPLKYKATKTVEAILHQILRCDYDDRVKSLYMEGKILELAAAFVN